MTTHEVTSTVIPIPPDFPVSWADPEDEALPLIQSRQHAPLPITPLTGWIQETRFGKGSSAGFAAAGQPLAMHCRRVKTYSYIAVVPSIPPEQMEEAGQRANEMIQASIRNFGRRWDEEWLPEVQGCQEIWNRFDLREASNDELLDHVEWTLNTFERFWDIHFEVAVPFFVAPSMFQDLYDDLFGNSEDLVAYKLLQGFENASIVAIRELWSLAQSADAETRRVILDTPAADLESALQSSPRGSEFLGRFRSYLAEYGKRSDGVVEFADPSWIEDPTIAINNLKSYLADGAEDPDTHWRQIVAEREQYVAEARAKLASYPEAVRDQFEMHLACGQDGHRVQEDHNWWIDQMGNHQVRQVFLECGRRLAAADVVDSQDDVFYLTGDEITAAILAASPKDFSGVVSERKAEMERWDEVLPPPMIGTDYGHPPSSPFSVAFGRFFGGPPPAPDPERPDVVPGTPGSPGVITGTARVIRKLSESGRLGVGEILVTITTAPPWTPLFATAGGIVTDTGGPLSHCAIVAREYGLPAVVGTGMATAVIQDGQQIEVNGDTGEVRIL